MTTSRTELLDLELAKLNLLTEDIEGMLMLSRNVFPFVLIVMLATCLHAQNQFKVHALNVDSEFSAANVIDVDGDSDLDVICGDFWYQMPEGKQFRFREVENIRGRYDDYSNLLLDVDEDGDQDIISVNYRSKSLYWCENPGPEVMAKNPTSTWIKSTIAKPGTSETDRLTDIDGDGKLDILPSGTSFAAWFSCQRQDSKWTWRQHTLPQELIGHGIGAGDLNGDGRCDIVGPSGWAEAPQDARKGRWRWHPDFRLGHDCGLPILVVDVDGDGDNDLIWGRGHDYGIYWTEQCSDTASGSLATNIFSGQPPPAPQLAVTSGRWRTHAIDTEWSCAHTLMMADIDGDGQDELVTGKRFQGHDGRDPGENAPLRIAAYRWDHSQRTWHRDYLSFGGNVGIDLDSTCVDLDGDGDQDILAPARCGLHWLENLGIVNNQPNDENAVPLQLPQRSPYQLLQLHDGSKVQEITSSLEFGVRQFQIRSAFESVAGKLPNPSRRVPLDVRADSFEINKADETASSYARIHLTFASDGNHRVPAYLLVPLVQEHPMPAALCLHPTHFELGKSQICGLGGQESRFYAHELARRGYVVLAPDYPGFAEYTHDFASDDYESGTMLAVWDNIRAIDLLESLTYVDRDRIAAIGHSLGGHNAIFTAVFDGRIRAVVSSCGFTAMEDYKEGDLTGWTSLRYLPGLRQFSSATELPFDFPELLGAIAPRPIFVSAPLRDDNFSVTGVRKCEASLRPAYAMLGHPENLVFQYPDAGHDFPTETRSAAYEWLDRVLNKK